MDFPKGSVTVVESIAVHVLHQPPQKRLVKNFQTEGVICPQGMVLFLIVRLPCLPS